jgi:hypothetical protein
MTTGNHVYDDRVLASGGGWWGTLVQINWNGADRPKSTKPPIDTYDTYREYTDRAGIVRRKLFTFKVPRRVPQGDTPFRVPKRVYDEEHAYNKDVLRTFEDHVTYNVYPGWSPPGPTFSDMTQHGVTNWACENLLDSNDQIKLVGKMKDQLDGSDFNLGVFLGEMGPALDLIGDTAGRLGKAYGYARGGQFGKAADQLFSGTSRHQKKRHPNFSQKHWNEGKDAKVALANNWLELQYGWLPLLKDVEAAAQMLAHHLNVPMRKTYRSHVHREKTVSRNTLSPPSGGGTATAIAVKTHDRWLIARIEEKGSIPQMLGLANPELVLWELLPYSFVADWFIPIGNWMEARALVSRLKGTFITCDKQMATGHTPVSSNFAYKPRGKRFQMLFSRTVGTTVKVPMPTFKPLPKIASWQHCANAVGLLISGFAGRKD